MHQFVIDLFVKISVFVAENKINFVAKNKMLFYDDLLFSFTQQT
jgi:hypothetical protein